MKPKILNQRYRLVDLVGAGGMATVYRGQDLLLERTVAIKFLREPYASDPDFRDRFMGEARAAARLDHPNIVHIYDVGEDQQNHPYIVMEMVEGKDLKSFIRHNAPIPVPKALSLVRQICAGVGNAHRSRIIHCDLKPQNILVTPEGQIKVADFGIARALHAEETAPEEETQDIVWGSPHYISPEQVMGKTPTAASDVYSIGIILYEMLTGVPPFHDPDTTQLAMKHQRDEPPLVSAINPRVPPGLELLVRKVLSKEPANRYRNADQFGIALDEYMRQGENMTTPQAVVNASTPSPKSKKIVSPLQTSSNIKVESDTQPISPSEGPDFMLWALLGVAIIAVLGLVPLWFFVYQAYAPTTTTLPTPVVTTASPATPSTKEAMISVPNLLDLNAADAQQRLQSLGLQIEVLGEQESTEVRPGAILEQTPSAGTQVAPNTMVSVILAAGRAFNVPDVVGYDLETVQSGLESEGLLLVTEEIWSEKPAGTILKQNPTANTEVRVGQTVTLTLSGGIDHPIPLNVNLNNQIMLEEAQVSQLVYRPGDSVSVILRWRSLQAVNRSYKVFVHLLTQDMNTLIAQQDIEPVNGLRPTQSWMPGDVINDPHQVLLPQNTPTGTYQIRVGLYDAEGRLQVVDSGQTKVSADTVFITNIEVKP